MELVVTTSGNGLACALTAHYARLTTTHGGPINVSILTEKCATHLSIRKQVPLLLTAESGALTEAVTIMQYIALHSQFAKILTNATPQGKAEVMQWMSFAAQRSFCITDASSINAINSHLIQRTFFANTNITLADLAMFCALYNFVKGASLKELMVHPHIFRWFDHMQHLPGIQGAIDCMYIIPLPQDTTIRQGLKSVATPTKEEQVDKANKMEENKHRPKKESEKKQSKEKVKTEKKSAEKPVAQDERSVDDVTRLEVRAGIIKKIWWHEDADMLYCEEIDIGEAQPRSIISGLVPFFKEEELLNQKVLVVANMKPKTIRGLPSHGMVLCVSSVDKSKVELLKPPPDTPVGERIRWGSLIGEADAVMNTKAGKNPFVAVQPSFRTSDERVGYYKDQKFLTSMGSCFCDSIIGGTIS